MTYTDSTLNTEIEECLRALLKKNECYPEVIFKDAPVDVRDYLIEQVNRGSDTLSSWIGDKRVINLFYHTTQNTQYFSAEMNVP